MSIHQEDVALSKLMQTQNLLDLELHELRPILYPKLLHLMEIEKLDDHLIANKKQPARSLEDIYIDENLIIKNRSTISRSLLDDRCIVAYVLQRSCTVGESILKQIKYRFYKKIRYSGKDYSKKLFNALLEHSLTTGKTIIIDKNIKLERIGQNTQWKIDFTNFLLTNCKSSYEWLNHIRLSKVRELGLLTLRNHLNQQMIRQHRSEINNRLQQEIQNHLDKAQQVKKMTKKRTNQNNRIAQEIKNLNLDSLGNDHVAKYSNESPYKTNFYSSTVNEIQLNFAEQKVQNAIDELSCLQSSKYANQALDLKANLSQYQNRTFDRLNDEHLTCETYQSTNEFESNLLKRSHLLDLNEIRDILEEERIRNNDQEESDEDEMMVTTPNYRQQKKSKGWCKLKRIRRRLQQNLRFIELRLIRFLRTQTFNLLVRYEEIQNHPIIIEQLNAFGQEVSLPLPANVPYCQIGKSSVIAALKQFNWSHTQGPFLMND